ncbi:C-C motif chemokine 13-like [Sander vitreus]
MKSPVALVLLICFLHHTMSAGPVALQMLEGECCPRYNEIRIPKSRVKHVEMTPSHCTLKAVVFTTVCKKFCIDPDLQWVKNMLIKFKDQPAVTFKPQKYKQCAEKV